MVPSRCLNNGSRAAFPQRLGGAWWLQGINSGTYRIRVERAVTDTVRAPQTTLVIAYAIPSPDPRLWSAQTILAVAHTIP
jgi:hypothetical protein